VYLCRRHVTGLIYGVAAGADASCIYLESFSFSFLYTIEYTHTVLPNFHIVTVMTGICRMTSDDRTTPFWRSYSVQTRSALQWLAASQIKILTGHIHYTSGVLRVFQQRPDIGAVKISVLLRPSLTERKIAEFLGLYHEQLVNGAEVYNNMIRTNHNPTIHRDWNSTDQII